MKHLAFVVPGKLDTLTGGYGYDRRIIDGLRGAGWIVDLVQLDGSFPDPTSRALDQAAHALAAIRTDAAVVIDGLAGGAMPAQIEREAGRLRIVALVHHPLASESGLERSVADRLETQERRALAGARVVVVTSRSTAASLERYGVAADRVRVVEPGIDPAPLARGSRAAITHLLSVATLIPRKGHEILFHALAALSHRDWRLTCVGSLDRHPQTVDRLRRVLVAHQLEDVVSLAGELDGERLAAQYDGADVFVLPTLHEGYGMAVAEALARGLPVISTPTGAIPDLIVSDFPAGAIASRGEAGILVRPNDVSALTGALSQVIGDSALRARLAEGARHVRDRLATWADASRRMAEVIVRVQR